jgi:hypothetical protein
VVRRKIDVPFETLVELDMRDAIPNVSDIRISFILHILTPDFAREENLA